MFDISRRSPYGERGLKFPLLPPGHQLVKVAPLTGSVD